MPTLSEPTIVLVKPTPFGKIQSGDILVFNYRNRLIVHRALKKTGGSWLTQGDSLENRDRMKVSFSNYRGMVYSDRDPRQGASNRACGEVAKSQA